MDPVIQWIPATLLPEAIHNESSFSWYGGQLIETVFEQFTKYTYPSSEGMSGIHMIWSDGPCYTVCSVHGHKAIDAFRSPNLEFILVQHPWMENDCLYADIVLPTTSTFEDDDMEYEQGAYNTLLYMEKCIPPVGESKSDYEALIPIAEKLGIREEFTGGKTVQEWMKFIWENSGVANDITWEDLKEKQYFAAGANPEWVNVTPYLLDFYNDPDTNPLPTPSGKLEIQSSRLLESFPDDIERPPVPHWVPGGSEEDGYLHDEFRDGERGEHYPLLMVCNTPKWRLHAQCDDIPWIREISKIKGPDGYMYEPLWVNPVDAVARGLETGDVVKIYNDRGATLAAVSVNERTIAGGVI